MIGSSRREGTGRIIRQAVAVAEAADGVAGDVRVSSVGERIATLSCGTGAAYLARRRGGKWVADSEPRVTGLPPGALLSEAEVTGLLSAWMQAVPSAESPRETVAGACAVTRKAAGAFRRDIGGVKAGGGERNVPLGSDSRG